MKILLVTDRPYLPQQVGGREWVIHETARELIQAGHKAFVMCGLESSGWLYLRNRLNQRLTGREYTVDQKVGYPIYRGWSWQTGIQDITSKVKPDVVILETRTPIKYIEKLEQLGIPSVVRLHDTALQLLEDGPDQYPNTQFIAVSEYLANRFRTKFDKPITVIRPLVRRDSCTTETTRKKVVFVNPRPVKGGDIAIAVAERCPDIPFKFFEAWLKDSEVEKLEKKARTLPNIEWSPSVMDPKKIYEDAHTVLFPSKSDETWGRVATEAHINGIPVIASVAGALPESVGSGGILIPKEAGIEAWVTALRALWDDSEYYEKINRAALAYSQRPEVDAGNIQRQLLEVIATCKE